MLIPPQVHTLDNPHMRTAKSLFTKPSSWSTLKPQIRFVFICYTNRCGSNLLAELLASGKETNVAGEYLNADTIAAITSHFGTASLSDHLDIVMRQEGRTSLFAMKIALTHVLLLHEAGFFEANLSRCTFILLERHDVLGQAISTQIAGQNLRWTSRQTAQIKDEDLKFSQIDIKMTVDGIITQNSLWRRLFAHNKIPYLHIIYEHLLDDRARVLANLARYVGVQEAFDHTRLSIERQQTSIAEDWRRLYTAV